MKFWEEYPELHGYPDPPYLLRIQEAKGLPNTSQNRSPESSALKNNRTVPKTLLSLESDLATSEPESQDWPPYTSPYISDVEADIREVFENAQIERENRELLTIARENYERVYQSVKGMSYLALDEDVRVLLMPKLIEKMIEREEDRVKRYNLEFLRDSFYLWLSDTVSPEPNTNVLYYPYHMILGYSHGNEAHKTHLQKFFNGKAREVIENRLVRDKLFTDHKEFFDFTSAHPSDWHTAAHQNTSVEHGYLNFKNAKIPQFQALGDYSLGALARGYTMPAGGGKHYICITNAYSFVNDSFDFDGFQWLGFWDFKNGDFSVKWPYDMILYNHTFREFAKRTKHGRDFRVVSPLYEIPKKELEFKGKEVINGDICWKVKK